MNLIWSVIVMGVIMVGPIVVNLIVVSTLDSNPLLVPGLTVKIVFSDICQTPVGGVVSTSVAASFHFMNFGRPLVQPILIVVINDVFRTLVPETVGDFFVLGLLQGRGQLSFLQLLPVDSLMVDEEKVSRVSLHFSRMLH